MVSGIPLARLEYVNEEMNFQMLEKKEEGSNECSYKDLSYKLINELGNEQKKKLLEKLVNVEIE